MQVLHPVRSQGIAQNDTIQQTSHRSIGKNTGGWRLCLGISSKELRERQAYVGFLEGRVFQGRDFQEELVGFEILSLEKTLDWWDFELRDWWVQVLSLGFFLGRVELGHLCLEG